MNRHFKSLTGKFVLTVVAFTLFHAGSTALAANGVLVEGMFAVDFQTSQASAGIYNFTVNGIGVLSNVGTSSIQVQKTLDLTGKVPVFSGTFTITAVNGDTLTGDYLAVPSATDAAGYTPFSGVLTIRGGTGRFQAAAGAVSFSALASSNTSQAVYSMKGMVQTE
jgi:hypothetical protein